MNKILEGIYKLFFDFGPLSTSAGIILGILCITNVLYSRSQLIKMTLHGIYQSTSSVVKEYAYRSKFLYFFIFVICVAGCNNVISALSFHSIMSDPYVVLVFIGSDVLLGLIAGLYYKKYRAITDIAEPTLPLSLRFMFFPIEFIILIARITTICARLFINATISHAVLDNLICACDTNNSILMKIIIFNIVVIIKAMDLFIGLIHPRILVTQMSMIFGKFNEEHNEVH
jgi:hypothetical protein